MSDFRFGADDYKLSYYPHEASDGMGGVDWDKVESVEIEFDTYVKERTCSPKFYDNLRETDGAGDAWAICSECGWLLCVLTEKQEWPRYCPGCGAKVVSE